MMDNQYNYYRPDSAGIRSRTAAESESSKTEKRLRKESRTCCRSSRIIWGSRRCDDAGNQLSDW